MAVLTQILAPALQSVSAKRARSSTARQALGAWGEQIAISHFKRQGYQVEQSNWRFGRVGELDLVLLHPQEQTRVFVEVKTRKGNDCGSALEAITPTKQTTLFQLAEAYLTIQADNVENSTNHYTPRIDVLGVTFPGQNRPAVLEHIQNAF